MDGWQTVVVLLSFWAMVAVGIKLVRQNWRRLSSGVLAQGGNTALMADEWHLSSEARAAIRQAFLVLIGLLLAGEGFLFSAVSIYTLLFR